jgi:hypothetical protein
MSVAQQPAGTVEPALAHATELIASHPVLETG